MGVFYPRHGDGGLIVQRDGYRRGGVGDEEIVLAPDGGAAARRQRPGDAILQSRRRRTLAGEIDQFCKRRRLRNAADEVSRKKTAVFMIGISIHRVPKNTYRASGNTPGACSTARYTGCDWRIFRKGRS